MACRQEYYRYGAFLSLAQLSPHHLADGQFQPARGPGFNAELSGDVPRDSGMSRFGVDQGVDPDRFG